MYRMNIRRLKKGEKKANQLRTRDTRESSSDFPEDYFLLYISYTG
jgi:hypothetical protein